MRPTSINDEDAERLLTHRRTTNEYEGENDGSGSVTLSDDRARASGIYTHITDRTGSGEEEAEDILGNGENVLAGVSCEEHSWRGLLFFDSLSGVCPTALLRVTSRRHCNIPSFLHHAHVHQYVCSSARSIDPSH